MKLDFLNDVSLDNLDPADGLVRLYDFNKDEVSQLMELIRSEVLGKRSILIIDEVSYVTAVNCKLTLKLASVDIGVVKLEDNQLICNLSENGYAEMLVTLSQFTTDNSGSYDWLADSPNGINFLFSWSGEW